LIGFPAGVVRMPFVPFIAVTLVGSTIWCAVLALFGARIIGQQPGLLDDPAALSAVIKDNLLWFVVLILGLGAGWMFVKWFSLRGDRAKA
jgi:membrane protein DedA with SNARE-associated domain